MASLGLVFDILARDQASPTFRKVGDSAERAGKQAEGFGGRIGGAVKGVDGLVGSLKVAAAGFAGAAIVSGLKALYDQAAESARVGRLTTQVIKSTGGAANITAKQVGDLATAISNKTGVDDEAIQSGENLLLTFTNVRNEVGRGNDIFSQATGILTDMSVALGQDTSTSAIQLGKALNDPIKGVSALQRVGVSFTQSQKDQITTLVQSGKTMEAQKIILAELSKEFGGAAAAASTPFDKLQVQLGNVAEQLGGYLIPAVDAFAKFLSHDALPAVSAIADAVGPVLGGALHVAGAALGVVFKAVQGVVKIFESLPGPLQAGVVAAGAWALAGGKIITVLKPLGGAFSGIRGVMSAFSEALGYARANGDGLTTVLKSAGGYVKDQAVGAFKNLARAIGPELGIAAAVYGISLLVADFDKMTHSGDAAAKKISDINQSISDTSGNAAKIDAIAQSVDTLRRSLADTQGVLDAGIGASSDDLFRSFIGIPAIVSQNAAAYKDASTSADLYKKAIADLDAKQARANFTADQLARTLGLSRGQVQALADKYGIDLSLGLDAARAGFDHAGTSADDLGTAAGNAGVASDVLKDQLQNVADAASAAHAETDLLKTALDVLSGNTVDLSTAQADLYAAVDAADGALKHLKGSVLDGSGALDTQTEAGRKAQEILFGVRDAGNQYIATLEEQGASTEEVVARDKQLRESFIKSAEQMGISRQDAENLADQILGIPSERETEIKADTTSAVKKAQDFVDQLLGIPNRTVDISADTQAARDTVNRLIGDLQSQGFFGVLHFFQGHAAGGLIDGFSPTPTADNVLIRATAGEFMQPVASVNHYGMPFMEAVRTGRFPREIAQSYVGAFAGGGYIPPAGYPDFVGRVALNDSVAQQLQSYTPPPVSGVSIPATAVAAIVRSVANSFGWGGSAEFAALAWIISHESGWRPTAQNPTSTAYGLFQFLNSTWAGTGIGKTSDPYLQSVAGLRYIQSRYGDPLAAQRFWQAHGYYDNGGYLQPGYTLAYNGTGKRETVRTAEQEAALTQGPAEFTGNLYLDSGEFLGKVRGVAERVTTEAVRGMRLRGARNG